MAIGGFRGGVEGAAAPPFLLVFPKCFTILLWKSFYKMLFHSYLSSETLTLLYFASRIRPQCCMLHVLKSEVFIRGVGWDSAPSFWVFWIRPWWQWFNTLYHVDVCCYRLCVKWCDGLHLWKESVLCKTVSNVRASSTILSTAKWARW